LGAHALAKLYQSTGRPAEARTVLAPALKGFSPTPEMPEIAEAMALMHRLAWGCSEPRSLFRVLNGMAAFARAPVLPDATV
jgi:hypothetical protein